MTSRLLNYLFNLEVRGAEGGSPPVGKNLQARDPTDKPEVGRGLLENMAGGFTIRWPNIDSSRTRKNNGFID